MTGDTDKKCPSKEFLICIKWIKEIATIKPSKSEPESPIKILYLFPQILNVRNAASDIIIGMVNERY